MKIQYVQASEKNARRRNGKTSKQKVNSTLYGRFLICGGIFILAVSLKLLLPGHLKKTRESLGHYMTREADFVSAFSSIGHAISGDQSVSQSVREACVAVFGSSIENNTAAVFATQEDESAQVMREYPQYASAEEHILNFPYQSPLAYDAVTSGFAWREDPNGGEDEFHYGIDLAAEEGSQISAFADGTVGVVGESTELGKYMTVQHANGISTLYAHCKEISVHPDETVKKGQKIAAVGQSGNATGAHLHFEVLDGEVYLNPQYYLSSQAD